MIAWYDFRINTYREITDTNLDYELRRYINADEDMMTLYIYAGKHHTYVTSVCVFVNRIEVKFADEGLIIIDF